MNSGSVIVVGGGLAGLSCAAALAGAGHAVRVLEAKPFPGGRATSYPLSRTDSVPEETVDNCQHILMRCCVNLLDFYRRVGVASKIRFHREFFFIEPGGRVSTLRAGALPAPAHFTGSFLKLSFLGVADKLAIGRALLALSSERLRRDDLDRITMLDWLREKRQTKRAIERFWRQILVSAVNEELDRMAARHGFQVMWLGLLAGRNGYEMGVPNVRLGELYGSELWERFENVEFSCRSPVEELMCSRQRVQGAVTAGEAHQADYYVAAVPFERIGAMIPGLGIDTSTWEHSPITGIHLWFDRPVTELPHGTLLDRTIQWFFNKEGGRYIQLVVSASRGLLRKSKAEVVELAVRELREFLPRVGGAKLVKAHVIKEARATFSAKPGLDAQRPGPNTRYPNLFLAGDWTRTGWPSTMEGAVRSGYLAAEAVTAAAGSPRSFVVPDFA